MSRYIDADDVVKRYDELVNKVESGNGHYSTGNEARESLKDLLDDCPTADVRENVRGGWKYSHANCYVCSICGHCISIDDQAKNDWYRHNYCGHCGSDNHWERDGYGADMRGEAND